MGGATSQCTCQFSPVANHGTATKNYTKKGIMFILKQRQWLQFVLRSFNYKVAVDQLVEQDGQK